MIQVSYYKKDSLNIFKAIGKDLILAYKLKEASKEFGDTRDQVFCAKQFQHLKSALEILSRFHKCTRLIFTNEQKEEFLLEVTGYYSMTGHLIGA